MWIERSGRRSRAIRSVTLATSGVRGEVLPERLSVWNCNRVTVETGRIVGQNVNCDYLVGLSKVTSAAGTMTASAGENSEHLVSNSNVEHGVDDGHRPAVRECEKGDHLAKGIQSRCFA